MTRKLALALYLSLGIAATAAMTVADTAEAQRRGGGMRPGAGGMRPGAGGAGTYQVRRNANTNINHNTNINRNINVNRNVDIDVHHEYGYGYHWNDHYHPVARAAAVAVTTAAVVGAYYRSLPTNCVAIVRGSVTYYQCGSAWYRPTYVGSSIQYVVINAP